MASYFLDVLRLFRLCFSLNASEAQNFACSFSFIAVPINHTLNIFFCSSSNGLFIPQASELRKSNSSIISLSLFEFGLFESNSPFDFHSFSRFTFQYVTNITQKSEAQKQSRIHDLVLHLASEPGSRTFHTPHFHHFDSRAGAWCHTQHSTYSQSWSENLICDPIWRNPPSDTCVVDPFLWTWMPVLTYS